MENNPRTEWLRKPGGLADQLRTLRTDAGLSVRALGAETTIHPSRVSRIENGLTLPSAPDIRLWVAAAGGPPSVAEALVMLASEGEARYADLRRIMRAGVAAAQHDVDHLIAGSERIAFFELTFIPGPLQTAAYARALLPTLSLDPIPDDDLARALALRARRWEALHDPGKQWDLLMSEAALYHRPAEAGAPLLRLQMGSIRGVLGLPNVRIGVIPLDRALHAWPVAPFAIYDDTVMVEMQAGAETLSGEKAADYQRWFDRLWTQAVDDVDQVAAMLDRAAATR